MNKTLQLIGMGKDGSYAILAPDFENSMFVKTDKTIYANKLTPFGFFFMHSAHKIAHENDKEDVAKRTFRTFVSSLEEKAKEMGAEYCLIELIENDDRMISFRDWEIRGNCQFYQKIHFEHVSAPVYRH